MLTLKETEKSLGDLRLGETKLFTVEVNADVDTPVNSLEVGCGSCTKARLIGNPVKQNVPSVLEVEFTPNSTGLNKKTIVLSYDSGKKDKKGKVVNNNLLFRFNATVTNDPVLQT